ncbi:Rho GTPase, partial [Rhizoctonia solani AG-3 Rhs1AP]
MRRDVRVLLVGDDSVGKSTIVTSLIKEEYVDNVQHVVPEVTIPPEVTPENVTTYIVDSSAAPADRPHLESEIRKAHVICVVYAIDNPNSFDRVPTYWLPYFRSLGVNVPVILVGNKIDLRGGEVSNEDLENEVAPIMEEFKACRFCHSAIDNLITSAVLHPTAPLYDSREHTLKPAAVDALRRIFRLCDINKDGVLDTHELNEFQDQDGALRPEELENLFNTSPGNPWAAEDDEGVDGTITLQHWLAKWSMTTLLDHKKTLAYLAYLGYNTGPTTGALKITKPRRPERRKDRLAGGGVETSISKDASKSKGKGVGELGPYTPTEKVLSVVGAVELRGAEKYLVMQEFGSKSEANMLRDVKTMDLADVIIYVHDSSDTNSFSYISGLRRHEVQPDVYCRRLGLQGPYAVSIKNPQIANLFPEIVATAINPLHAIPGGAERASATLARRKIVLSGTGTVGGQAG